MTITQSGTFAFNLWGNGPDLPSTCGSASPRRDVAYVLCIDRQMDVSLQAALDTVNQQVTLSLRSTCEDSGTELACKHVTSGVAKLEYVPLQPGTYFVIVEGYVPTTGALYVTIKEPPPRLYGVNSCESAESNLPITQAMSLPATPAVLGFVPMVSGNEDLAPSCTPPAWFQYAGNKVTVAPVVFDQDVLLTVMHTSNGLSKRTAWSLTEDCDSDLEELFCDPGSVNSIRPIAVPAGSYYFHVAGNQLPEYVVVEPMPPPSTHTTCATALPIANPLNDNEDSRLVASESRWYTFLAPYSGLFVGVYTVKPWVASVGSYRWKLFASCSDTVPIADVTITSGNDNALQATGSPPGTRFYLQLVTATPGLRPGFVVKFWPF
jgi:hypothetical protein